MKGIGDIMKQAQAMQENMQKMQEDMANRDVCGESGAGMVKVTMNGRHHINHYSTEPNQSPWCCVNR